MVNPGGESGKPAQELGGETAGAAEGRVGLPGQPPRPPRQHHKSYSDQWFTARHSASPVLARRLRNGHRGRLSL